MTLTLIGWERCSEFEDLRLIARDAVLKSGYVYVPDVSNLFPGRMGIVKLEVNPRFKCEIQAFDHICSEKDDAGIILQHSEED